MDKKKNIRQQLLVRRGAISKAEFLQKSAQICDRMIELEAFQQAQIIHCYVSMNERREVNTHLLIKEMLAAGKKVVVPVTQFQSGTLRHVEITSFSNLQPNKWGVLEPRDGEEVAPGTLDLVIVPMAGGDRQKNRIGYGKGFYDRFLQQIHCPSIGLLFEQCLVDTIPTESFDVPLDMLITENELI